MPTQIIRFKCDFCKKTYSSKYDAAKHEKKCLYNPDNKSCGSCMYAGETVDEAGEHMYWCYELKKQIYKKYNIIKDCPGWKQYSEELNF